MALKELSPAQSEPLDLAYAKTFLRIDTADEDALLGTLIKSARQQVESLIGRALIRRTWHYTADIPGGARLCLPMPPLVSVLAVRLKDEADTVLQIPSTDYGVKTHVEPGEIYVRDGQHWREFQAGAKLIEIEFIAGYGMSADDVPLPIRQAIMLLVTQHFEHRGLGDNVAVPAMVDALLAPYQAVRL